MSAAGCMGATMRCTWSVSSVADQASATWVSMVISSPLAWMRRCPASAIALDGTVARIVLLLPPLIRLLGDDNGHLPSWLRGAG